MPGFMSPSRWIAPVLAALVLAACSAPPVRVDFAQTAAAGNVWPRPPDPPRILLLGEFTTPGDIGIAKSAWSRIADFIAGSRVDALLLPMAVAASDGGERIYVADPEAQAVHLFDRARGRYERLVPEGRKPLPSPVGLALSPQGRLFVTDSQLGQVFVAEPGSSILTPLPIKEPLAQPTGIAYEPASGRLFVAETAAHRVSVFEPSGELLQRIGHRGNGEGEFNFPTYLWVTDDGLQVTDSLNFRVQLFDAEYRFEGSLGAVGSSPGSLPRPKGVATDASGHVYVIDALLHDLQVFDPGGALLLALGAQGTLAGEFWLPSGLWIARDDTIYVADSRNRRVQVFRYVGPKS